jgi:tetratricopeptide (TPR) repeat protein
MLTSARTRPAARRLVAALFALLLLHAGPVLQRSPAAAACIEGPFPAQALAAAWFPEDGLLAWRAGRALLQSGRTEEGLCFLERARARLEDSPELSIEIGDALAERSDLEGALADWELAREQSASPDEVLPRLLWAYERRQQWNELQRALALWIELHPEDSAARYRQALLGAVRAPASVVGDLRTLALLNAADSDGAGTLVEIITSALKEGGEVFALARVGEFLLREGKPGLAESALLAALDRNPGYGEALAYLGLAHEQMGQPAGGEYAQAVELAPDSAQARLLYGSFLLREGELNKGRLELEQAWTLDPHSATIAAERGQLEFAAGDLVAAETWYAQGVQVAPQSVEAWLARAAFYIGNQLRVGSDGIASAREAVALAPNDPRALDLLGLAWSLEGDLPLAERMYWQALSADPNYALSYIHLGMLAEVRGDRDDARAYYQAAVQVAESEAVGDLARAALTRIP